MKYRCFLIGDDPDATNLTLMPLSQLAAPYWPFPAMGSKRHDFLSILTDFISIL